MFPNQICFIIQTLSKFYPKFSQSHAHSLYSNAHPLSSICWLNCHWCQQGNCSHLISYIMMIRIVQPMNWWCGYVDWLMVMDHVERCINGTLTMLVEALGDGSCRWCIDGTLTMLVEALGKHAWSWILLYMYTWRLVLEWSP